MLFIVYNNRGKGTKKIWNLQEKNIDLSDYMLHNIFIRFFGEELSELNTLSDHCIRVLASTKKTAFGRSFFVSCWQQVYGSITTSNTLPASTSFFNVACTVSAVIDSTAAL